MLERLQHVQRNFYQNREAILSQEKAKEYMEDRLTQRRNDFITEYKKGFYGSAVLTYEPALDREVFRELKRLRLMNVAAHQEVLQGLKDYTKFQVESFIGERLNVGLSRFQYDLRDGVMYGQGMKEPLLDMIARGRDTREIVGTDVDKPRQEAEIEQFKKIQGIMGNSNTAVGTTILSFSPPGGEGSAYAHNFYDVFVLREKNGVRYVEARRYASGLSIDESLIKANDFESEYDRTLLVSGKPVDAFLISRPIVFKEGDTFFGEPDTLHRALQGKEGAMSYEEFQSTVLQDRLFSEMVVRYLQTLEEKPEDTKLLEKTLNAIMNRADEISGKRDAIFVGKHEWRGLRRHAVAMPLAGNIDMFIHAYSRQQVRQVTTGCGLSGGFGSENGRKRLPSNMSARSIMGGVLGEDDYGKRTFECPECHTTNYRPYNGLLAHCQQCGSDKVAC